MPFEITDWENAANLTDNEAVEQTASHLWEDEDGVHVTEKPREEHQEQRGSAAVFGPDGVVIASERTRMEIDSDSMMVTDTNGERFLGIGLMNDALGRFTTTGVITGAGATYAALPFLEATIESVVKTSASGSKATLAAGTGYTYDGIGITLKAALVAGESVSVTYSVDWPVPFLTAGYRPKKDDGTDYIVGPYSSVLGQGVASGYCAHAEGQATAGKNADGTLAMAFPYALGNGSHAEGIGTRAGGDGSHAGGYISQANGENSFAHGSGASAPGNQAAAFGMGTYAPRSSSFACGSYNVGKTTSLFEVGKGTVVNGTPQYANAFEVDENGRPYFNGGALPIVSGGSGQTGSSSGNAISTLLTANTGFTVTAVQWALWGKVLTAYITFTSANAIGSGNIGNLTVATLKTPYRPKVPAPVSTGAGGPVMVGNVNTNGTIVIAATGGAISAGTTGLTLCGTWVIA